MFKRKQKEPVKVIVAEQPQSQTQMECKTTCSTTCKFIVGNHEVTITTGDTNAAYITRTNQSGYSSFLSLVSKEELLHLCKEIIHKLNTFPT